MDILDKIYDDLCIRLALHHQLYTLRCRSEYLEEIVSKSACDCGMSSDWKDDLNHKVGVDQIINDLRISNKSGQYNNHKKDWVKISGSRTSKFSSLEDKVNFLSQKNFDFMILAATCNKEWQAGNKFYHLIKIDQETLNYKNLKWITEKDKKGRNKYKTCPNTHKNIKGLIGADENANGQLWTWVHKSLFSYHKILNWQDLL